MSRGVEARIRRLEKARPEQLGGFQIWFEDSGELKPETKPGDTLIVFHQDEREAARDPARKSGDGY